mmetsp:Transcript_145821/g.271527  ORF Transcript_145821/g.271527 Transcript_145821/m.271527 type:complete len:238 (+) Transcript_145821:47-760(+)
MGPAVNDSVLSYCILTSCTTVFQSTSESQRTSGSIGASSFAGSGAAGAAAAGAGAGAADGGCGVRLPLEFCGTITAADPVQGLCAVCGRRRAPCLWPCRLARLPRQLLARPGAPCAGQAGAARCEAGWVELPLEAVRSFRPIRASPVRASALILGAHVVARRSAGPLSVLHARREPLLLIAKPTPHCLSARQQQAGVPRACHTDDNLRGGPVRRGLCLFPPGDFAHTCGLRWCNPNA